MVFFYGSHYSRYLPVLTHSFPTRRSSDLGLSTFSTTNEMDYLLAASGVSFVLFDGGIVKRDFGATLAALEPQIHRVAPGQLQSFRFPFLRHMCSLPAGAQDIHDVSNNAAGHESWRDSPAHGRRVSGREYVSEDV